MKNPCPECKDYNKECRYCEAKHEWLIETLTNEFNQIVGANERRLAAIGIKKKADRGFKITEETVIINHANVTGNWSTTR